jgi:hypothetical protein
VVNNGGGNSLARTGLVVDRPEPAFAQFTGGGSKDELDIPRWKHRSGTPPAKDDITNAYAAAYTNEDDGHSILVFGIDRFDTSGDAQLGFWFLQDEVQPIAGGTFSGAHIVGDILVLVNFSGGGTTPNIEVFQWNGTTAVPVPGTAGAVLCTNGYIPAGQNHCGITNSVNVAAPWAYVNKDVGVTTQFPPGAFFEGAIDLTAIGLDVCITNFLAESRSSTSISAVLKDFATPEAGFNVCAIEVTKACTNPRLNADQDMIIYDISGGVTAIGGTVFNVTLSDSPDADGAFQEVDCADPSIVLGSFPLTSLDSGVEACYLNTITVALDQNGLTDTVTARANTESDGTGVVLTDSDSADCPNLQISPALSISKDCTSLVELTANGVVAQVNVFGTVCNVGDTDLSNVAVTDDKAGTLLSGGSLIAPDDPMDPGATPGACADYSGNYTPSEANDADGNPTTDPSAVVFKDTATATADDIFGEPVMEQSDMAECPLCP